jgi:spermidine synthase
MTRKSWRTLAGAFAVVTLSGTSGAAVAGDLLSSERSLYRDVLIYQDGSERCMCFTRQCSIGRQSCVDLANPKRFALNYTRLMLGGALFTADPPRRVLIVGLGGGTLPMALAELLPEAQIDVAEIDPAVTRAAKKFFAFKDGPKMRVIEEDGRVHVKRAGRAGVRYDLVMLDAFDHEYIPEHLLTREFLTEVKTLLGDRGVLVANTFSSSALYDHESTTYAAVFGSFYNLKRENRVIVARMGGLPDVAELERRSRDYEAGLKEHGVDRQAVLALFSTKRDWNEKARVLTDQYSPANLLNH